MRQLDSRHIVRSQETLHLWSQIVICRRRGNTVRKEIEALSILQTSGLISLPIQTGSYYFGLC